MSHTHKQERVYTRDLKPGDEIVDVGVVRVVSDEFVSEELHGNGWHFVEYESGRIVRYHKSTVWIVNRKIERRPFEWGGKKLYVLNGPNRQVALTMHDGAILEGNVCVETLGGVTCVALDDLYEAVKHLKEGNRNV